jgi:hypothetical protein
LTSLPQMSRQSCNAVLQGLTGPLSSIQLICEGRGFGAHSSHVIEARVMQTCSGPSALLATPARYGQPPGSFCIL